MDTLTKALIIQSLVWSISFEIMCDASDFTIGVVLDQKVDKKPIVIYNAS